MSHSIVALVVWAVWVKKTQTGREGEREGCGSSYVDGGGLAWLCGGGTTFEHLTHRHTTLQRRVTHVHAEAKVLFISNTTPSFP